MLNESLTEKVLKGRQNEKTDFPRSPKGKTKCVNRGCFVLFLRSSLVVSAETPLPLQTLYLTFS